MKPPPAHTEASLIGPFGLDMFGGHTTLRSLIALRGQISPNLGDRPIIKI
jgi:hypothetical protein